MSLQNGPIRVTVTHTGNREKADNALVMMKYVLPELERVLGLSYPMPFINVHVGDNGKYSSNPGRVNLSQSGNVLFLGGGLHEATHIFDNYFTEEIKDQQIIRTYFAGFPLWYREGIATILPELALRTKLPETILKNPNFDSFYSLAKRYENGKERLENKNLLGVPLSQFAGNSLDIDIDAQDKGTVFFVELMKIIGEGTLLEANKRMIMEYRANPQPKVGQEFIYQTILDTTRELKGEDIANRAGTYMNNQMFAPAK